MSLVPSKRYQNMELYAIFNKPVLMPGEEAKIHLLASGEKGKVIHVSVFDDEKTIYEGDLTIGETPIVGVIPYEAPGKPGFYSVRVKTGDVLLDEVSFIVHARGQRRPRGLALVWHHHQAPNYLPDGSIHGPWAFIYVYGNSLRPYGNAPYSYHAAMLEKHRDYHATYNLSPSLIKQWHTAVKQGVVFKTGEQLTPGDERARIIEDTVAKYVRAYERGQIDVLTSIYAHTIGGFLIDVLGMEDVIRDEVRYGISITKEVLGVTPLGAWTPEMAFSMKLIDIYYDNGIEYTVLDDKCHFEGAEGEKTSSYEPYIALNKESGKHIVVYFRNHELSDVLSFKNNFTSEVHALRNAYEMSLTIAKRILESSGRILTLALDGENWMVFSGNPPLTAFYLDKLLLFLESLSDAGFLRLMSLREVYSELPATRILTKIPTNTWLCTFKKWRGEKEGHEEYWLKAVDTYRRIKTYEYMVGGRDPYSEKARWALWHALDSDYWWAEFWSPKIIDVWLNESLRCIDERLREIRVKDVKIPERVISGVTTTIVVDIVNGLDTPVKVRIKASCPSNGCSSEKEVGIPGRTTVNIPLEIVVRDSGLIPVSVAVEAESYVLSSIVKEVKAYPLIPANPV
ncbi:glycoside hydrolase family 57 protein [Desulfurococcus mucosus]|uniref:Glycoside hydrolase family 57 n=1 Tax=Desulfurococcus mucosus (strain ATCC 35584 / DSM 2162 / JCM 9187 / O7/1) TaxID=765177 RepID=E8R988_DESM0|nr:glycoside hydrolase family 57 protein [Desulfurococcus mucosus]ADV65064.1 glycoside hydrolase family 57 [Desulfurococcus mucosus DSM 2162]